MNRTFQVVVIREHKRPLAYPSMNGERSLRCMQTLAKRGLETVALTKAGEIQEELTLAEMIAVYGVPTAHDALVRLASTPYG